MDTVREGAAARAVTRPDGSVDLSATARPLLESPPSAVTGERTSEMASEPGVARNGCRERPLGARVGRVAPRVPKPREGGYFPDEIVSRWPGTDTAPASCVRGMRAGGVPAGKAGALGESDPVLVRAGCGRAAEPPAAVDSWSPRRSVARHMWPLVATLSSRCSRATGR